MSRCTRDDKGEIYRGWALAAPFTIFVVYSTEAKTEAVGTRISTVLAHTLSERFEKIGTLKTHFVDTALEAHFSETISLVIDFDFAHAAFEFNTFPSIGLFDRRGKSWRDGASGHHGVGEIETAGCARRYRK